jgi:two-component system chemotaxis sensor kinase CheA
MTLDLDELKKTFFAECDERLAELEAHLDSIGSDSDPEILHAIFRAVHSIKGGAGTFGFDALANFSHEFESLLDSLRVGKIQITPSLVSLLLKSMDTLSDLVSSENGSEYFPAGHGQDIIVAIKTTMAGIKPGDAIVATPLIEDVDEQESTKLQTFTIKINPREKLYHNGGEPRLLLRELRRLGSLETSCDTSSIPLMSIFNCNEAYLRWNLRLTSNASSAEVEEVFEFVEGDCELEIAPQIGTSPGKNNNQTVEIDATPQHEDLTELQIPDISRSSDRAGKHKPEMARGSSIRVDLTRIDRLATLVGEIVTTQAMLSEEIARLSSQTNLQINHNLDSMARHVRDLQEGVMAIRAQPIGTVFARLPRVVREASDALGKQARLLIKGEATEIDTTVIERLSDPLTHMLRNAVDHGIEDPSERLRLGKPPQGTITLSAEHRAGRIIIEVSDDGRGIDHSRILKRAHQVGITDYGEQSNKDDIAKLIFMPGFSTSANISKISGRGFGMDVVKKSIDSLGGRISITSALGAGSKFILSLPLTLAVLDGMIVRVGTENYVLPITSIIESLRPEKSDIHFVAGIGDLITVRGQQVRLFYLGEKFGINGAIKNPAKGVVVVAEADEGRPIGIVVDDLIGQQQVVIKSVEENYRQISGISAATILGSGKVALILDLAGIENGFSEGMGFPPMPRDR